MVTAIKSLLAYSEPWSVRPGEDVALHVSSDRGADYEMEFVRLIGGAQAGDAAVVTLEHPQAGSYHGVRRAIRAGSYAEASPVVHRSDFPAVGVRLHCFATVPCRGKQQVLASHFRGSAGFVVGIDANGHLTFTVGDGERTTTVRSAASIRARRWYLVEALWNPDDEQTSIHAVGHGVWPDPEVDEATFGPFSPAPAGTPLRFAADTDDAEGPRHFFNGRIEDPEVLGPDGQVLASWDLSRGLGGFTAVDLGPQHVELVLVNGPTRAVPGRNWDGSAHDPRSEPRHFGAVHFHEDDISDCRWPADITLTLPDNLASGIYGFLLRTADDRTVVPFFVRAEPASDLAPVAFLASTATYLAYANNRLPTQSPVYELSETFQTSTIDVEQSTISQRPDLGPSLYDHHVDGHPCYLVSRRRPMLDITQGGALWTLNADLDVVAWLERAVARYDVITDEDLHTEGLDALTGYRCIVTGSHPEYWSTKMWDAMVAFLEAGGRLMYMGGNGFYWRVSHSANEPWLMECRRAETGERYSEAPPGEYHHQFGGELGGLWRRIGRPPQGLVGVGMAGDGWDSGSPYFFQDDAENDRVAFMLEGIDRSAALGAHGAFGNPPGAAGAEIDHADFQLGTPLHALVVASSGPHSANYVVAPEETLFLHRGNGGDVNPLLRADVVFFETPAGGAVFSTGSIAWSASLPTDDFNNDVARLTTNVVRRFADPAPFPPPDGFGR